MEDKIVNVGVFWAIPDKFAGQSILEVHKSFYSGEADGSGFINYPYSHYEVWEDEVEGLGDDCYKYPRGRVIYDANAAKHRIFADECIWQSTLDEVAELFDIESYDLFRDEHYVCDKCQKNANHLDCENRDKKSICTQAVTQPKKI